MSRAGPRQHDGLPDAPGKPSTLFRTERFASSWDVTEENLRPSYTSLLQIVELMNGFVR